MTWLGFIFLLVIAAVAGALGQAVAGYSLGGCLMSIVVGFVGAYIGTWLARQLSLPEPLPIHSRVKHFPWYGLLSARLFSQQYSACSSGAAG